MKNSITTGLSIFAMVVSSQAQNPQPPAPSCCRNTAAQSPALSDRSIYQVESTWTSDTGRTMRLVDLRGKPQVIAMFFTHCQFACPALVHDMQQVEAALPEKLRSKVGFTLVSFDTERDTPAVLAAYRRQHSLDPERWTLLRGKADDVLELAALLGVNFKKDAQGQFAHSNVITLLNSDGEIIKRQIGLGQSGEGLVNAIREVGVVSQHQKPPTK